MSLMQALESIPLSAVPAELTATNVYEIDSKKPVVEALEELADKGFLSAPVYDATEKKYVGYLDIRDLVSYVVFAKNTQASLSLRELVSHAATMYNHSLDEMTTAYLARRNKWVAVSADSTVAKVVEELSKGCKRVAILNAEGRVANIISSSAVLCFLQAYMKDDLEKLYLGKVVKDVKIGSSPVLAVQMNTQAFEAFRMMDEKHLNGIAVVDPTGRLVGNTSARDLKRYVKYNEPLNQSIFEFLNKIRQASLKEMAPAINCKEEDTVSKVIAKLVATKVHRIFICDADRKPSRIITVNDIVKFVSTV